MNTDFISEFLDELKRMCEIEDIPTDSTYIMFMSQQEREKWGYEPVSTFDVGEYEALYLPPEFVLVKRV